LNNEVDEAGLLQRDVFEKYQLGKSHVAMLRVISQLDTVLAEIPMRYTFFVKPVAFVTRTNDIFSASNIASVEFGRVVIQLVFMIEFGQWRYQKVFVGQFQLFQSNLHFINQWRDREIQCFP
jgi:hypothetical protein